MNITIITPVFPYPLNSGGAQAQYNMIDMLRKKHNITLIYIQKNYKDNANEIKLKAIWPDVNIVSYKFSRQLLSPTFLYNKGKRAFDLLFRKNNRHFFVERALKPYGVFFTKSLINFINDNIQRNDTDIVQVEFYPCLGLIDYLQKNIKRVFIHHEIRFIRNERLLADISLDEREKEYFKQITAQEISDLNKYDQIVTLTGVDSNILKANGVRKDIVCSPAAINTQTHPYTPFDNKLLFLGGYSHKPNVEGMEWFVKNVASRLNVNSELHIVGSSWPATIIEQLQALTKCKIIYHGFVEDLYEVAKGSIMVIPILTGSGMRMKILEASAMALPFITTTVGVEGLDYKHMEACIIADKPEEWISYIERMVLNEDLRHSLATNAQMVYNKNYSISAAVAKREAIYSI